MFLEFNFQFSCFPSVSQRCSLSSFCLSLFGFFVPKPEGWEFFLPKLLPSFRLSFFLSFFLSFILSLSLSIILSPLSLSLYHSLSSLSLSISFSLISHSPPSHWLSVLLWQLLGGLLPPRRHNMVSKLSSEPTSKEGFSDASLQGAKRTHEPEVAHAIWAEISTKAIPISRKCQFVHKMFVHNFRAL